jgi:hypothetical protein
MFKEIVEVTELRNGDIKFYFPKNSMTKTYKPNFNIEQAIQNYNKFASKHKNSFYDENENIDWFNSVDYFLFHKIIWPFELYKEPLAELMSNEYNVKFKNKVRLYILYKIFSKNTLLNRINLKIFYKAETLLIFIRNLFFAQKSKRLFFKYNIDDYRLKNVEQAINDNITYAIGGGLSVILKNFTDKEYFFIGINRFISKQGLSDEETILNTLTSMINIQKQQKEIYEKLLKIKHYQTFLGVDDTLLLYPLLFACNKLGIITLGFQHGLYNKKNIGYSVKYSNNYIWFDYLFVLNSFWKEVYIENNNFFNSDKVMVYNPKIVSSKTYDSPRNKSILLMYESFFDEENYSFFIRKLIENGFKITMKLRPGVYESEVENYYCSIDEIILKQIEYVYDINDDIIHNTDIIVGAKTFLLFQLLTYKKPIWIVETRYHYLDEALENNIFTRYVKKSQFESINQFYEEDINKTIYSSFDKENLNINNILDKIEKGEV